MKVFHSSRRQKLWKTGGKSLASQLSFVTLLLPRIICGTGERSGQPRSYDYFLRYVKRLEQSVEQRVAPCFQNEYSDVVWFRQPDLTGQCLPIFMVCGVCGSRR
jgi:hypothetical protein